MAIYQKEFIYILENFKHKLPGNVVFDTNRNFEFANVRGYYFG